MHTTLTDALLAVVAALQAAHLAVTLHKPSTPPPDVDVPIAVPPAPEPEPVVEETPPVQVAAPPVAPFNAPTRLPWRKRKAALEAKHRRKREHLQEFEGDI